MSHVPSLVARDGGLVFIIETTLEVLKFKNAPMFPDGPINDAVKEEGPTAQKSKVTVMATDVQLKLGFRLPRVAPPASLRAYELEGAPSGRHAAAR